MAPFIIRLAMAGLFKAMMTGTIRRHIIRQVSRERDGCILFSGIETSSLK
jgi:hypothetical protein